MQVTLLHMVRGVASFFQEFSFDLLMHASPGSKKLHETNMPWNLQMSRKSVDQCRPFLHHHRPHTALEYSPQDVIFPFLPKRFLESQLSGKMPMMNKKGGVYDFINLIFLWLLFIKIAKSNQSLLCTENFAEHYFIFTSRETHLFDR